MRNRLLVLSTTLIIGFINIYGNRTDTFPEKWKIADKIELSVDRLLFENVNAKETRETYPDGLKTVYRKCLYDVINGTVYLSDGMDAMKYSDLGKLPVFALQDVTEDDVPELLVAMSYPHWTIYTAKGEQYEQFGDMDYYDTDSHKIYKSGWSTYETYYVYEIENNKLKLVSETGEADSENPYYRQDGDGNQTHITAEEMEKARNSYKAGLEKYGIKGVEITQENINSVLSLSDDNQENNNTSKTVNNVSLKKAKVKNKSVKLTWQSVKDVDGYQIQYSQKKGFPKKSTKSKNLKNSASSTNIKKLKKGKTYYFRIRTYTKTNGKKIYGKWSDKIKIKVGKKTKKKSHDYNSVITEKNVRKSLNIPKDAKIKIKYGKPVYLEYSKIWKIEVSVTGKGKYKGYKAGAYFDVNNGDTWGAMLTWCHS